MANTKNEHVFPNGKGWMVRREGSKKTSRLFRKRKEAVEYAGIVALHDGGSVVSHKHNGQFKGFTQGSEIKVRRHSIAPIITGTIEIMHPIVKNTAPIIETRNYI